MRELRNAIEVALTAGAGPVVEPADRPERLRARRLHVPGKVLTLADAERGAIEAALLATGGNKVQAALILGISRHRLYDKIRKYGLSPPKGT